jgi:hypothetical protein
MEKIQVAKDECPVAPAPRVTVYTRVLHRACQMVGGVDHLAARLRVSPTLLHRWLEGEDIPPSHIFLNAVDLVLPTWGPEDDALARAISAGKPKNTN